MVRVKRKVDLAYEMEICTKMEVEKPMKRGKNGSAEGGERR